MPLISVIVPVFNVEKYIGRCIESVKNQTFTDWELILVDDCGTDKSMDIIKAYASDDNRIKFLEGDYNEGPMVARDKGGKFSTGEYITFVDGDDTIPPNALSILYENAIRSEADIVVGEIIRINPNGEKFFLLPQKGNCILSRKEVMHKILTRSFPHNLCGKLFKCKLVRNELVRSFVGLTNGEDGFFFLQILTSSNRIKLINETVYEYWTYQTSSSHKKMTERMIRSIAVFEKYKYDVLHNELGDIDDEYYKSLTRGLYNLSKVYPYARIKKIFAEEGIVVKISIINVIRWYKPLTSLRYLWMFYFYSKMFV